MKAVTTIVLSFFAAGALAQEVIIATNAKTALKSCQEKATASPEELQAQMLAACQCIVKHTDFAKANQLHEEGKAAELKELYNKSVEVCYDDVNSAE